MATVQIPSAQPKPLDRGVRCDPSRKAPATSHPVSAGELTATGTVGRGLSGTSAIGHGIAMVPLPGRRAGLDQKRRSSRSTVPIIPAILVSTAIHLLGGDMILSAWLFIAIGALTSTRLLLPPIRLRWLVLVPALGGGDLLIVESGNNRWIPLPPREMRGNVTPDIPVAVSGVLSAVQLPAVTVHRVVMAAIDLTHVMRGA